MAATFTPRETLYHLAKADSYDEGLLVRESRALQLMQAHDKAKEAMGALIRAYFVADLEVGSTGMQGAVRLQTFQTAMT